MAEVKNSRVYRTVYIKLERYDSSYSRVRETC